jgi:glycosyltransferase involved in cell wall biosynthesis
VGTVQGWLIVAGDFAFHGGMDRANLELARHLAAEGAVHVVAHRVDEALGSLPNVTVHSVPRPLGKHLLGQPLLRRAGLRWAQRLSRQGYRVVVNGTNCPWPDVNWVHMVHSAFTPTTGGPWWRRWKVRQTHRWQCASERQVLPRARRLICNSQQTAQALVQHLGISPERVQVLYLGCDPQEFPPVNPGEREAVERQFGWAHRPRVIFIGQLGNSIKGFDTLYAAWRLLHQQGPWGKGSWDVELLVIGGGSMRRQWEEQVRADGLSGSIRFLGRRADVGRLLAAGDAVVAPSRYDAYNLAAHEALCRGLPALVSARAGISERYPPELHDLILSDPEDVGELAARLRHWFQRREEYAVRIRPFSEQLRSYSWADMARDFCTAVLTES